MSVNRVKVFVTDITGSAHHRVVAQAVALKVALLTPSGLRKRTEHVTGVAENDHAAERGGDHDPESARDRGDTFYLSQTHTHSEFFSSLYLICGTMCALNRRSRSRERKRTRSRERRRSRSRSKGRRSVIQLLMRGKSITTDCEY